VARLDARVVEIGRPVLGRELGTLEERELPGRKESDEFLELVRVRRADGRDQRRQRTPIT
jgi:hypothetical protein